MNTNKRHDIQFKHNKISKTFQPNIFIFISMIISYQIKSNALKIILLWLSNNKWCPIK